jgi:hypothetical protein
MPHGTVVQNIYGHNYCFFVTVSHLRPKIIFTSKAGACLRLSLKHALALVVNKCLTNFLCSLSEKSFCHKGNRDF